MNLHRITVSLAFVFSSYPALLMAAAPQPEPAIAAAAKPYDPTRSAANPIPAPAPNKGEATVQIPAASSSPLKRIGPAPQASITKSFLWEVKSATNTVYLFGTIHVGKRAFYPLSEKVESAFDSSAKLVVEADISNQAGDGDLTSLVGYASSDTLAQHIPRGLFERLKVQLLRLRIPTVTVLPMKPFVVGGFLSVVEFSRLGYDMSLGVDSYLISRAKQAGKPIEELESTRAQLELLSKMPADLQEAFLENAILTLESDKAADQVTGMVNAWQTGDAKLMEEVTQEANRGARLGMQLEQVLLYGRHDAMMKKIEGYLRAGEPYFVAVGSLHLVGPRGLIQALKASGYEVNQQ